LQLITGKAGGGQGSAAARRFRRRGVHGIVVNDLDSQSVASRRLSRFAPSVAEAVEAVGRCVGLG